MHNEMEALNEYEREERRLCSAFFAKFKDCKNLSFTPPGSFLRYDGTALLGDIPLMFEAKVRSFGVDDHDSYIMQLDKYRFLTSNWSTFLLGYVNFFVTDIYNIKDVIMFDIRKRFIRWGDKPPITDMSMNDATFRSNAKVNKPVILLEYDPKIDLKTSIVC